MSATDIKSWHSQGGGGDGGCGGLQPSFVSSQGGGDGGGGQLYENARPPSAVRYLPQGGGGGGGGGGGLQPSFVSSQGGGGGGGGDGGQCFWSIVRSSLPSL